MSSTKIDLLTDSEERFHLLHMASIVRIENGKVTHWADYDDGLTSRRTALAAQLEGRLRKTRLQRRAQKESLNV
jgi:hypothetical protein